MVGRHYARRVVEVGVRHLGRCRSARGSAVLLEWRARVKKQRWEIIWRGEQRSNNHREPDEETREHNRAQHLRCDATDRPCVGVSVTVKLDGG